MKELTIEQKAKAYDEAIKVIKDNLDALNEITETGANIVNIQSIRNCFYKAFPELQETYDEKIRKEILDCFKTMKQQGCFPSKHKEQYDSWIAWLEKMKDFDKQLEVQYKRGYGKGYADGMVAAKKKELKKQAAIKDGNSIDPHFGKPIITDCGAKEKIQEKIIELSHKEDQVWSEDDEEILNGIIDDFGDGKTSNMLQESWLKSIKDRMQ